MKKLLILLALLLAVGAPVMAQDKPKEEPKKEEPKKEEVDAYALYRVKGRSWTSKTTSKYSGMDMVSYYKMEITEVTETGCKYKMTTMDKDKKETYSSEMEMKFEKAEATKDGAAAPEMKQSEEKIKVEAGEFECIKYEGESGGYKWASWVSKKYAGLSVKSESKGDAGESVTELVELVEFKEGAGK